MKFNKAKRPSGRLEDLRVKLENEGLVNISYVVVNHQGAQSQRKFHLLKESVSDYINVYQQEEQQDDVWTTLNGNKDDFLIYDRYTFHGTIQCGWIDVNKMRCDKKRDLISGDMASWQQRTSLNPDSDVCSLLPDSQQQQEEVKPVTPDSDRKRRETEPEKQTKHLQNARESY
ncbi:hypothetical protein BTVI_42093 [Pitangus sulphuratus]|nr:hypothetical protein BTVI_42093 [Pitangus sulphuratus]